MLKYHHTGIIVDSINDSAKIYAGVFGAGSVSPTYYVSSQGVNVCFVKVGEENYIELVEPSGENTVIENMKKKGITYYHVGFLADDIEVETEKLRAVGYLQLNSFKSEAFGNRACSFLISSQMHLIELIQK